MKAKFLSFDYGKHRVEVPALKLDGNVAVLAKSGIRVKLDGVHKPRLINGVGK